MFNYADLFRLSKPGQYVDSELNAAAPKAGASVRVALLFPDLYEMGLPNFGLQILYRLANALPDVSCERAYAPASDAAALLRARGEPLRTLEGGVPLGVCDVLGVTLQSELTYTTILECLDLAGIPVSRAEREAAGGLTPLVVAGGPGAMNPAPLADVFDAFFLGDGERAFLDFLELVKEAKAAGVERGAFLRELERRVPSVFVPAHFAERYGPDGRLVAVERVAPGDARPVRAVVPRLERDGGAGRQLVPFVSCVHERAQVEIARGCRRGCRFCQAGFIYRPLREKAASSVAAEARAALAATGYEELGFVSLSTSDYPVLADVLDDIGPFCAARGVGISLPSLRMDSFSIGLANRVAAVRRTGLTFAPEAGTERLRAVINKNLSDAEVDAALEAAFASGWQKVKLYFMIGLPTETDEDLEGIVEVARRAVRAARANLPPRMFSRASIHVSVSTFVPKAHTPFQWERQVSAAEAERKIGFLRGRLRMRQVRLSFHDPRMAEVEGLLARGDRRAGAALVAAWRRGAVFDGWKELFNYEAWRAAAGPLIEDALRGREPSEALPWDAIDGLVSRAFLLRERERAYAARPTGPCAPGCVRCGVCGDGLDVVEGVAGEGR